MAKTNAIFINNYSGSNGDDSSSLSTETISTLADSIEFLTTLVPLHEQSWEQKFKFVLIKFHATHKLLYNDATIC